MRYILPEEDKTIRLAISAIESLEGGIMAKALRKKGTEEWYTYSESDDEWFNSPTPNTWEADDLILSYKLPPDAEMVNIIIVTPKNE